MSVLIDMEMPEKQTILTIVPTGYVAIYDAKDSFIGETKAFHVPPHGRLVDADALVQLFKEKATEHGGIGGIMVALATACIDAVPTIIAAEEGE